MALHDHTVEKVRMKTLRNLYYDYYHTIWFTLGLVISVTLSYQLSRFIPPELFENTISPMLHFCIIFVTILSAIQVHWHIDGIRARQVWQRVLVTWATLEIAIYILQYVFGIPAIIFDVQNLTSEDLMIRNLFVLLLMAYPMEVVYPRWLTFGKSTLILLPAFIIHTAGYYLDVDLRLLLIIYPLIIVAILFGKAVAYRKRCEENYSSLENTGVHWIRNYLICLVIIGFSYFYICFSDHPTRLFTQQWLVLFLFAYNTTQIISRKRPWQDTTLETQDGDSCGSDESAGADNAQEATDQQMFPPEYRNILDSWMQENKPYLDKEFRLVDLMQVLPVNRSYLSRYINTTYGCNFCQFVTTYRIEEAKRLLQERQDIKVQDVAEQTGFASASAFTRAFTKETGYTPTDWLRLQKLDNS